MFELETLETLAGAALPYWSARLSIHFGGTRRKWENGQNVILGLIKERDAFGLDYMEVYQQGCDTHPFSILMDTPDNREKVFDALADKTTDMPPRLGKGWPSLMSRGLLLPLP